MATDIEQELRARIEAYPASYSSEARKLDRALLGELSRLREALVIIREGRGKCKLCGKQAEGMGLGYVSCDDDRRCAWTEQDPQEVAARALPEGQE